VVSCINKFRQEFEDHLEGRASCCSQADG